MASEATESSAGTSVPVKKIAIPPKLTRREMEVLHWISEGKRSSEVAEELGISPRTVSKHVENILSKLNTNTRAGAVRIYLTQLLSPSIG